MKSNQNNIDFSGISHPELDLARFIIKSTEKEGHEALFAGGCVRDILLNRTPNDYDLATSALPEEVCKIFKQKSVAVIPTGLKHGTITIVRGTANVEITTFRKDVDTDGRHAQVEFSKSAEEDSKRRDFTMNGMYANAKGDLFDFHLGQKHMNEGVIKFIGQAEERIKEDYLRILRFYRFGSQLSFELDPEGREAAQQHFTSIQKISSERIREEWIKLLKGKASTKFLDAMSSEGLLDFIFDKKVVCKNFENIEILKQDTPLHYDYYLYSAMKLLDMKLDSYAKRFKLSNRSQKHLELFSYIGQQMHDFGSSTEQEIETYSCALVHDQLKLCEEVSEQNALQVLVTFLDKISNNNVLDKGWQIYLKQERAHGKLFDSMPLRGSDLMPLINNSEQQKKIGETLKILRRHYINRNWSKKTQGLERAKSILGD